MKRIKWIGLSLLLIFFLSSCDLLSSKDVEEYTEAYCQENPNSEICQGAIIENLQDATVEDLFWDMYQDLQNQEDICEQYISLSNLTLLDECRQGYDFFPDNIENYEIDYIQSDTSQDTNALEIALVKDAHTDYYIFNISVIQQGDDILIEQWEYEEMTFSNYEMYTSMLVEWTEALSATDFCTEWFITDNIPACQRLFQDSKDNDYTLNLTEYVEQAGGDQVKLVTTETIPQYLEFTVLFVKTGHTYKIDQERTSDVYDDYQPVLNQFILGLNSVSLSDAEVCGTYVELESYEHCVLKREEIINDSLTVTLDRFEWTNETTKTFEIDISYTAEDFNYVDTVEGFFYLNGDTIMIDIPLPYELSRNIRSSMLDILVMNMNDPEIDITTVVDVINDAETEAFIVSLRDYMFEQGLTIDSHDVTFGSTYFEFTLDNGDRYEYEVMFEYDAGYWYMSWERQYHLAEITLLDKTLLIDSYINAFNTGMATDDYICAAFLTDDTKEDCIVLREELWDNNQYLFLHEVDVTRSPSTIWFGVETEVGDETVLYLQYDLDFAVVDNTLLLSLSDEERFVPLTETDAGMILDTMILDLNDLDMSDEEFCGEYGAIFDDCMTFHSDVRADELFAAEGSLEPTDDEGVYDYILELFMMGLLWRELEIEVTVFEDLEETPVIMGHTITDTMLPPDEGYQTIFEAFLEDYFDESKTDQTIYDIYFEGIEFEGLYQRDYIQSQGITWVVNDITWHADMGFVWYEADVTFTRSDDIATDHIIKFELYPKYDGGLNLKLFFELEMPEQTIIDHFATAFNNDLSDLLMDQDSFCTHYFAEGDYDRCILFTNQLLDEPYTPTINVVTREEYYASILIDFEAMDTSITQLLFDLHPYHDIKGTVYLTTELQFPDAELRNNLSTYVVDGLIYGFGTHGINITTFCDEFATCGTAFDDITSTVHHLQYVEVGLNYDDIFSGNLQVKLEFNYYDGVVETHQYSATYVIEDDWYIWTLHFIHKVPLI